MSKLEYRMYFFVSLVTMLICDIKMTSNCKENNTFDNERKDIPRYS